MADWQFSPKVSTTQGYWVTAPKAAPSDTERTGWLSMDGAGTVNLWITDIEADFEAGGTYAQSQKRRDWYPHNFAQAKFKITGQCANQQQYGDLAEFVHDSHRQALKDTNKNVVTLTIPKGVSGGKAYQTYLVRGYIERIERKTTRFVNAPTFTFEFVVAYSYAGLFKQGQETIRTIKDWMDILEKNAAFTPDPDIPGQIAGLTDTALQHIGSLLGNTLGGG